MGLKEGEIMKHLIYDHGFFQRVESIDFQDVCSLSPYAPKVLGWVGSLFSIIVKVITRKRGE